MSKFNTIDVWNKMFGEKQEVYDYSGRIIKKSACGNPNSRFEPTIDHIRPISLGGSEVMENIILCNRVTNLEKDDKFPHWQSNGMRFHAEKIKGTQKGYKICKDN